MFNQMSIGPKEKKEIYKMFLNEKINWIEFYGRCRRSLLRDVRVRDSIFFNYRSPPNTLRGINGMMKPITYKRLKCWRRNCLKIVDLHLKSNLCFYSLFPLFWSPLTLNEYTLDEALKGLELKNDPTSIDFSLDLTKKDT